MMLNRLFTDYDSPLGRLTLTSDFEALTGVWFEGHWTHLDHPDFFYAKGSDFSPFHETILWLDSYFRGYCPKPSDLPISLEGTSFQLQVWDLLREIPYGCVVSYGAIARRIEQLTGKRSSARAVGGAVGRNPVSIIIPCHRVIGVDGSLTGFGGGLERKKWLLQHEESLGSCETRLW